VSDLHRCSSGYEYCIALGVNRAGFLLLNRYQENFVKTRSALQSSGTNVPTCRLNVSPEDHDGRWRRLIGAAVARSIR
jgi:predicted secreted protein